MLTICSCICFLYATEHLRTYLELSRFFVRNPRTLYPSVSREKGGGARKFFFCDMQNFVGSVCGDRFVTWGYCVRAVLEVEFKAVLSESQEVLTLVGLVLSGPHNCFSSLLTKSCSTCRLILVCMVQFGQGYLIGFPKTVPGVSRVRVPAVFPVDGRALCCLLYTSPSPRD